MALFPTWLSLAKTGLIGDLGSGSWAGLMHTWWARIINGCLFAAKYLGLCPCALRVLICGRVLRNLKRMRLGRHSACSTLPLPHRPVSLFFFFFSPSSCFWGGGFYVPSTQVPKYHMHAVREEDRVCCACATFGRWYVLAKGGRLPLSPTFPSLN
jgi:hypothetical protein